MMNTLTYTYGEAAERLGIGVRTLQRMVAEGSIRHVRVGTTGKGVRFREEHLDEWLRNQELGGAPLYVETVRAQAGKQQQRGA